MVLRICLESAVQAASPIFKISRAGSERSGLIHDPDRYVVLDGDRSSGRSDSGPGSVAGGEPL